MDFTKLTPDELSSFFNMYSVTPVGNPSEYASALFNQIGPQGKFPEAVVDLYIATQLKNGGLQVPSNYNVDNLKFSQFMELAGILSLPMEDTPSTRNRAKRIIRILTPSVQIEPVIYQGSNQIGDFKWMIKRPEYQDVLFLFNDNQEQFLDFLDYLNNPSMGKFYGCQAGGGNAIIRPYQCVNPPRAAGIPTGVNGEGYTSLHEAKPYIDAAFERIKRLLSTGLYRKLMYSAAEDGRSLGTSIFAPSDEIKEYIVNKIEGLIK
jgi:hypothetical protein